MSPLVKGPGRSDEKNNLVEEIAGYLFSERNAKVYAILDGASVQGLLDSLYRYQPEFECLYRGDLAPDLAEVAPYLVRLDRKSAFTDWVLGAWGKHWGVFVVTRADLRAMRGHFRRFLTVHSEEGKPMLFRFYDPRVLRAFLPTCNVAETEAFFGPVLNFLMEGDAATDLVRFQFTAGALSRQEKKLGEVR